MAINNNPLEAMRSPGPSFSPPEPPAYRAPEWQPSQRPPFEPPGFANPVNPALDPWQTGNELFRSQLGVDWLRQSNWPHFKW